MGQEFCIAELDMRVVLNKPSCTDWQFLDDRKSERFTAQNSTATWSMNEAELEASSL